MAQKLSGACACGAIDYVCSASPVIMLNCHCRDCQQASGSAYAAIVVVPKATVQIGGEPRYHKVVGQGGKAIERGFCPNCGSQVTVKLERLPDILGSPAGSLEDPSIYNGSYATVCLFLESGQSKSVEHACAFGRRDPYDPTVAR